MNQVCPDRQLLSVYLDGELPSPWKEKLESHVAVCPRCAKQLRLYQSLSLAVSGKEDTSAEAAPSAAAQERVWQKLEQGAGDESSGNAVQNRPRLYPGNRTVWRRRISVPLPAAAAAVALMAVLAFLMVFRTTGSLENSGTAAGMAFASEAELEIPGIVPVSNMEDVLQYLGNRDNGEIIILRLPEIPNFVNYGEPAIYNAADYSRQMPGRSTPGWRKP